jgi:hypothetical protein
MHAPNSKTCRRHDLSFQLCMPKRVLDRSKQFGLRRGKADRAWVGGAGLSIAESLTACVGESCPRVSTAAVDADDEGIGRKAGKGGRGILHQIRRTVLVIMM